MHSRTILQRRLSSIHIGSIVNNIITHIHTLYEEECIFYVDDWQTGLTSEEGEGGDRLTAL
jgi:hypothetical protein